MAPSVNQRDNQHLVQEAYLRRFAGKSKIWVYDKQNDTELQQPTKRVASADRYYDLPREIVDSDDEIKVIDKSLQVIEQPFSDVLGTLLGKLHRDQPIDQIDKRILARWIALQSIRTSNYRKRLVEMQEKLRLVVSLGVALPTAFVNAANSSITESHRHALALDRELQGHELEEELLLHDWYIRPSDPSRLLYTSDNPVVLSDLFTADENRFERPNYFGHPGCQLGLPLHPRFLLVIAYLDPENRGQKPLDYDSVPLAPEQVEFHNTLQVWQSRREVFSRERSFELARHLCSENPELKNPSREVTSFFKIDIDKQFLNRIMTKREPGD